MTKPINYGAAPPEAGLTPDKLARIADLCRREVQLWNGLADIEQQQREAQAEYDALTKDTLPELCRECGVSRVDLEDGYVLRVEDDIRANIPEDTRAAAHDWLRANGLGSVIKNVIGVTFGMGQESAAEKLYAALAKKYETVERKEAVHSSSLRSLVTEMLAGHVQHEGKVLSVPESISYVSLPVAKIKEPKGHETRKQRKK